MTPEPDTAQNFLKIQARKRVHPDSHERIRPARGVAPDPLTLVLRQKKSPSPTRMTARFGMIRPLEVE